MLHVSAPQCALSGPHRRPGSSRCLVQAQQFGWFAPGATQHAATAIEEAAGHT